MVIYSLAVKAFCTVLVSCDVIEINWKGAVFISLIEVRQVSICLPVEVCEYMLIEDVSPS